MKEEKVGSKQSPQNEAETHTDTLLEEVHNDIYSTIKRWESLYPHTYGDLILAELLSRN